MLYFIPWALFLMLVILAVPIASFLEKRKHQSSTPEPESFGDDDAAESREPVADADESFAGSVEEEPVEVQFDAPGGDDFSAFDEDFK